jgi:hypothetical protein
MLKSHFPTPWSAEDTAVVPVAGAKCQSEGALFVFGSSLQQLVRNIEAKNFLIGFSLGQLIMHGTCPHRALHQLTHAKIDRIRS